MKRFLPFLLLFTGLALAGCAFSLAEDITPPPGSVQSAPQSTQPPTATGPLYPLVPPDPANGAVIFAEKCAPCHGLTGQGDGAQAANLPRPAAPLSDPRLGRQGIPADWYLLVTRGDLERFMPPFNSLSDRERWDVVAYALTLSISEAELAAGELLYQENCAACHGLRGKGDGPEAAGLEAEISSFADQALMARQSQSDWMPAITDGVPPAMPAFADELAETERWQLTSYLRSFTFASDTRIAAEEPDSQPEASETESRPESESEPSQDEESTAPETEREEPIGLVSGQVTNISDGEVPADLQVTLRGFDDMTEVISMTVPLEPDGSYQFEEIEMPVGRVFLATVDYKGATYGSDIAVVEEGTTSMVLPLSVYETTSDASIMSADRLHLFFEFADEETLRVIQLFIMSNPSGLTLVPPEEGEPSLSFKLPDGARNLEFQEGALGGRFIETSDGFGDTVAIRPGAGTYEILYAYEMDYDRRLDLTLPMTFPVDAVVILVPDNGLKIRSDLLEDEGTRDVQGTQYRVYNASELPAGTDLALSLSGRPDLGSSVSLAAGSSTSLIIGLGGFGLALIAAGVWLYRRSRPGEVLAEEGLEQGNDVISPQEANGETVESLMDAIIALDDLYQDGELPEPAYLKRRAELKARLKESLGDE